MSEQIKAIRFHEYGGSEKPVLACSPADRKTSLHMVLPASIQGRLKPLDSFMDQAQQRAMEMNGFKDLLEQRTRAT